jgi:hypothetical protein
MNRGKLVIVTIVSVAVVAAVFSTWYHYRNQHRALDFWGTTTAVLIAEGPTVRVYQLGESAPAAEESVAGDEASPASESAEGNAPPSAVEFTGLEWKVVATKDAKAAKGINNVRRALVLDLTYDWQSPRPAEPQWQYALAVNDGRYWATLLFDFDTRQVALAGGKKTVLLDREANDDLHEFFKEQFVSDSPGNQTTSPADDPAAKPADEPAEEPIAEPTEAK